jgi:hypothetical protein
MRSASSGRRAGGFILMASRRPRMACHGTFSPWDDDLIPVSEAAGRALKCAIAGLPVPPRDGR